MNAPRPLRVFFLHNPKAAGTGITFRFREAIGVDNSMSTDRSMSEDRSEWKSYGRFDFIHGHCGYELYDALGRDYLLITSFRHPVSRIVSLYDFWRHNIESALPVDEYMNLPAPPATATAPYLARRLSFEDFLNSDDRGVQIYTRNFHARQLLNTPWKYSQLGRFDLFTLKRRVKEMHWFHISEHPALSDIWFERQFPGIAKGPLPVENATDYSVRPRTLPSPKDIETILRHNEIDLKLYEFALRHMHTRLGSEEHTASASKPGSISDLKAEPSPAPAAAVRSENVQFAAARPDRDTATISGAANALEHKETQGDHMPANFNPRRLVSAIRYFEALPRVVRQIEERLAAVESQLQAVASAPPPPQPAPEVEQRSNDEVAPSFRHDVEVSNVRYLAFPEQIPPEQPVYIVGLEKMAIWTLRFLQSRGYTATAFISDAVESPATFRALPVISRATALRTLKRDDVVIVASPHRDSLVKEFDVVDYLFDATELYQFVNVFSEEDTSDILVDDLCMSYWRQAPGDAARFGEVGRRLRKLPTHQYVRNIEKAVGPGTRFVVNIGCHDGISVDPCYPLYKDGWKGWAIDGVPEEHEVAQAAKRNLNFPDVKLTFGTFVTPHNAKDLLVKNGAPLDCDLIKVDIDSYDGPVIQAILEGGWRPRVFCVEVNADIPPPFRFMVEYRDDECGPDSALGMYGCSAGWAAKIFEECGYTFARYEFGFPKMIGGIRDMVFVRNDVFSASGATPGISWQDAYYAEPLGWSHTRSGLKIDPRNWRHAKNPREMAPVIEKALREGTKAAIDRYIPFSLEC